MIITLLTLMVFLEYKNRRCSHCTSKNTHKKGYTWTTIYLEKGVPLRVKVKRYYCPSLL